MRRTVVTAAVITGATGFVGGELLRELLLESNRSLICPIRATSDEAALERGAKRLCDLLGESRSEEYAHRVEWVRADIEETQLGWAPTQWHDIALRTDEVYHCAASVAFDLPLDQAQRINVEGTKHVFMLAVEAARLHHRFQRFHHVSTAYVAGVANGRVDSDFLPPDRARNFRNTYERTKARAERFIRAAATEQVPVSIYRPSIIAGNSKTGATSNWNVLYIPMKMVTKGRAPALPCGGRQLLDTVAVDFLVQAMMIFTQLDAKRVESHHITAGETAFTVTEAYRETANEAWRNGLSPSNTKLLGPIRWWMLERIVDIAALLPKRFRKIRGSARLAQRSIGQCAPYLPYTSVNVIFDARRDHELMRVFGAEMPNGSEYLRTLVSFAIGTNFGRWEAAAALRSATT